jgi:hypothetical protein
MAARHGHLIHMQKFVFFLALPSFSLDDAGDVGLICHRVLA